MTILEAIVTAIDNLEAIRLPIRDVDNANRVRNALALLDALRENAERQTTDTNQEDGQREADPEERRVDAE